MKRLRRIRNIGRYLPRECENKEVVVYAVLDTLEEFLALSLDLKDEGLCVPNGVNAVFVENINGKCIIDRTKMESYSYTIHSDAPNFGDLSRGTHPVKRTITKQRYCRVYLKPLLVRLAYRVETTGKVVVFSERIQAANEGLERLLFTVNMFHSILPFGWRIGEEPELTSTPFAELPFEILPPGEWPSDHMHIVGKRAEAKEKSIRLTEQVIRNFHPDASAVGRDLMRGYFAYVFSAKGVVVLENQYYGNATYVIDFDEWQETAAKTKYEVYNGTKLVERIIHNAEWENKLTKLLH